MSYFTTCPHCGANLDPGEKCDCRKALEKEAFDLLMQLTPAQLDRLISEWENKMASRSQADQSTLQEAINHQTTGAGIISISAPL